MRFNTCSPLVRNHRGLCLARLGAHFVLRVPSCHTLRGSGSPEAPYHEASRPLQDELLSLVLRVKPSLARRVDPNRENEGGWKQWVAGMLNVSRHANRIDV